MIKYKGPEIVCKILGHVWEHPFNDKRRCLFCGRKEQLITIKQDAWLKVQEFDIPAN